jgi:hypothetical protein
MQYKPAKIVLFFMVSSILAWLPQIARATSSEYALSRVINVAILRIPYTVPQYLSNGQSNPDYVPGSNQSGASPSATLLAPYMFDILSNRPDIIPPLWKLQNPLAPPTVDSEVNSRFGGIYSLGQQVLPNMAPYWEVDLNKISSGSQLAQFNLLVIRTNGMITLTIPERQILRQYVDQGGTLWIDGAYYSQGTTSVGTVLDSTNLFRVYFTTTPATSSPSATTTSYHPIADSPYALNSNNIAALGYGEASSVTFGSDINSGYAPDNTLFTSIGGSIIAGDYGAGHVIIDSQGIADAINSEQTTASNSANLPSSMLTTDETNYTSTPSVDLEFLVNLISYATSSQTTGGNTRGNGNQGGNISGALDSSWNYPLQNGIPEGIATFGRFAFTTDNLGNVSSFNVNPSSPVYPTDNVNGDDGVPDLSAGASYDQIWTAHPAGGPLSAPVVALLPFQTQNNPALAVVLIQDQYGNVYGYDATADPGSGTSYTQPTYKFKLGSSSGTAFQTISPTTGAVIVPGPTYYRGELLAPQPSGVVDVYQAPFTSGATPAFTFSIIYTDLTGPLLAASIPNLDTTGYGGEDIVAYAVSASQGINTYELGARDEHLPNPQSPSNQPNQPNPSQATNPFQASTHNWPGISTDPLTNTSEDGYFVGGNWALNYAESNETNGAFANVFDETVTNAEASNLTVSVPEDSSDIYVDFDLAPPQNSPPLRTTIVAVPQDSSASSGLQVLGAAIGADNIIYTTVNESGTVNGSPALGYIEAINEQAPVVDSPSGITWRFLLDGTSPAAGQTADSVVDADGIGYDFSGYQFIGAPVVGNNGVVYALAYSSAAKASRLMAFNTTPALGFQAPVTSTGTNEPFQVEQANEGGQTVLLNLSQHVGGTFVDFSPLPNGTLQPDLFVPGTVIVTPNENGVAEQPILEPTDTAQNGAEPLLEWYTQVPVVATSGPRLVGDYIYFGANNATTVAILADPQRIGLLPTPVSRLIAATSDYRLVQYMPSAAGSPTIAPAGTDKYLVTASATGFEGLAYNSIIVADGNRLIELDPSGNAAWTLDSTDEESQTQAANQAVGGVNIQLPSFTTVQLNRPSTVTQLTSGDYLIADTGNNRVVQVDRSGNVLTQVTDSYGHQMSTELLSSAGNYEIHGSQIPLNLEISSFNDPLGIVPVGEPLTLNQPTSVVTWLTYEYANGVGATNSYPTQINAHYLIADTGNNRLVDIVDRYTETGATPGSANTYGFKQGSTAGYSPDFHYIDWISHTSDIGNRLYKYVGAEPILNNVASSPGISSANYPDGTTVGTNDQVVNAAVAIIGIVGDKNISALAGNFTTPSNLTSVNQDTSGSSILLLKYSNGYPYVATSGSAGSESGLPTELINAVAFGNSAQTPTIYPLRGLRSAIATSYSVDSPGFVSFVIADDDGVFDGTFDAANAPSSTNLTVANPNIVSTDPYILDATYGSTSLGWSFVASDYSNIVNQYDMLLNGISANSSVNVYNYQTTPFVAASAIEVSGDNYLIVNRGLSGNPNAPALNGAIDNGFGGNVFTVHASKSATQPPIDLLDGLIYGQPANTSALSAPAFAIRSQ